MTLAAALSSLNVPVCHVPYRGKDEKYVTYQSIGQRDVLFADGAEQETAEQYAVNVYMKAYDKAFLATVKNALNANGFTAVFDTEIYEKDVDRTRVVLFATTLGCNNG